MSQTLTLVIIYQLSEFKKHHILEAQDWKLVQIWVFLLHISAASRFIYYRGRNNKSCSPRELLSKGSVCCFTWRWGGIYWAALQTIEHVIKIQ